MDENIEPKQVVPIVAGNTKILGLGGPEWAISSVVFAMYFCFAGKLVWIFAMIQLFGTFVYIFFLSKLEENIIFVLLASAKLPDIVYGSFNKPLPLDKKSTDELKISEE
jgi:hypothetical protein